MRRIGFAGELDLLRTFAPLVAGRFDPTTRLARRQLLRATRTPEGPATLHLALVGRGELRARAWGPGAGWALEGVPELLALDADPADAIPASGPLRGPARRARGLRLARTRRVVELLTLIVLQQKVSGRESMRAFGNLVRAFSEPAPGPGGLWLPVAPGVLRELPAAALPPLGVPERRGATLRELGWRARRVEEAAALPPVEAERRLRAVPGIGVWSARLAALLGLGHADAVPLGDHNLPRLVAFQLAGEERADDPRMLELLEPFRPRRGLALRWIAAAGRHPPRRAPRAPLRPLPRAV